MTISIQAELDDVVAERRLLDHPFYSAWTRGLLNRDDLACYAAQYWRQVKAFPAYLTVLAERLPPSAARQTVVSNLADELGGDHPGLWVRFAKALGHSEASLEATTPLRQTQTCVQRFGDAAAKAPVPFALGMLYGYESQTPAVAAVKVEGLQTHYGISGASTRYFEVHSELDVEHAADMAVAIDAVVETRTDRIDAKSGAQAGADAVLGLLDGVTWARGIDARVSAN